MIRDSNPRIWGILYGRSLTHIDTHTSFSHLTIRCRAPSTSTSTSTGRSFVLCHLLLQTIPPSAALLLLVCYIPLVSSFRISGMDHLLANTSNSSPLLSNWFLCFACLQMLPSNLPVPCGKIISFCFFRSDPNMSGLWNLCARPSFIQRQSIQSNKFPSLSMPHHPFSCSVGRVKAAQRGKIILLHTSRGSECSLPCPKVVVVDQDGEGHQEPRLLHQIPSVLHQPRVNPQEV